MISVQVKLASLDLCLCLLEPVALLILQVCDAALPGTATGGDSGHLTVLAPSSGARFAVERRDPLVCLTEKVFIEQLNRLSYSAESLVHLQQDRGL